MIVSGGAQREVQPVQRKGKMGHDGRKPRASVNGGEEEFVTNAAASAGDPRFLRRARALATLPEHASNSRPIRVR